MPRRPRIDMVRFYHIVNRGVEQRIVYKDDQDTFGKDGSSPGM